MNQVKQAIIELLHQHTGIKEITKPEWYKVPDNGWASDYLLRLEQSLAIIMANQEQNEDFKLYGQHEMLDGVLKLCVNKPSNTNAKILLAQTFRQLQNINPDIVSDFKNKLKQFLSDNTFNNQIEIASQKTLKEVLERIDRQ